MVNSGNGIAFANTTSMCSSKSNPILERPMTKFCVPLAFAVVLFTGAPTRSEDKPKADQKAPFNLTGDYLIVSGEKYGTKIPDEEIVGTQVHFEDDRILVEDKDHKSTPYIATYKVDTSKKPYAITMTPLIGEYKGQVVKGLVEKNGDQVKIIYALPGGEVPTEFKTKDKQLMFTMKVMSKE
jgi:uncharacterized protein (TIGR03067 family)